MITRRNLLFIIPLSLLLTFPLWRAPIANFLQPPDLPRQKETDQKETEKRYDFSMSGLNLVQSEGGKTTAVIQATRSLTGELPNEYILEGMSGDIYDRDGEKFKIQSQLAIYNTQTKLLELQGNVLIVKDKDASSIQTETLHYDGRKRILDSPTAVVMTGKGIKVKGTHFRHDMNKGVSEIGGRIFCTISFTKN